jgi:hypothetical protein
MSVTSSKEVTALLATRFQGTILTRRSVIPLWLQQGIVSVLFLAGCASAVIAVIKATGTSGNLWWALASFGTIIGLIGCDHLNATPLHSAPVPAALPVSGGRWVHLADLTAIPGYHEYFRTSGGALLQIERRATRCQAIEVDYLPDQAAAVERQRARTQMARELVARGKLDAARGLVDGAVDGWRLR